MRDDLAEVRADTHGVLAGTLMNSARNFRC